MEIEKQQQQLNRMAVLRHSMIVQAQIASSRASHNAHAQMHHARFGSSQTTKDLRESTYEPAPIHLEDIPERDTFYDAESHDHTHAPVKFAVPGQGQGQGHIPVHIHSFGIMMVNYRE